MNLFVSKINKKYVQAASVISEQGHILYFQYSVKFVVQNVVTSVV